MKTATIAFIFIILAHHNSDAQVPIVNMFNIIPVGQNSTQTITNNEKITGEPFFVNDWNKGLVVLENGNTYNNYLLKYNTNNQTLLFLSGKESMEINEKVKEFVLLINGVRPIHFINANVFTTKTKGYFETVGDNTECQLLKLNKKIGQSISEKLTNLNEAKSFENTSEYYIFDKTENKLTSYRKAPPRLKSMFDLNAN